MSSKRIKSAGFTLIELMIVVAIIGILASVAVPAFIKYIRRAKTVEATESLDKIKMGAREYFVTDHWSSAGTLLSKRFPPPMFSPFAAPCCQKCVNTSAEWDAAGWGSLRFALTEPHYYSLWFTSVGTGNSATYQATAFGDLDCDGTFSVYNIRGSVDNEGSVVTVGPIITRELE